MGIFFYVRSVMTVAHKAVDNSYAATKYSAKVSLKNGKPFSVLLLGTDTGSGSGFGADRDRAGLTDSIMIMVINPKKSRTTIVSIPRDIMTSIPGFENTFPQKINAAYAFKEASDDNVSLGDGVSTLMLTLKKMFNLPINYYAMVDMSGLSQVVDQLGGIKVKSPTTFTFSQETAHEYGTNLYKFKKNSRTFKYASDGTTFKSFKSMNGAAALAFSRMRYQDPLGDYGRTNRQRLVLKSIINKAKGNPTKILKAKFLKKMSSNLATNLTWADLKQISMKYSAAGKKVFSYSVEGQEQVYNGISFQRVTTKQRQALTNKLRNELGLKAVDTGAEFASQITAEQLVAVGTADNLYPEKNTDSDEILKKR